MTWPAHRVQPDIAAALAQTRGADVRGVAAAGLTWITMAHVGEAELGWLDAHFNVHPLAMDDLTSRNQRPKVDDYGASLFIVLYFPKPSTDPERLTAVELNMLVGDDYVLSVPRSGIPGLAELFEQYGQNPALRDEDFGRGIGYLLYRLIDRAVDSGFPILRTMGTNLEQIEARLLSGGSRTIVQEIARIKMDTITFRRVVRPQRATYGQLRRALDQRGGDAASLEAYYDDLTDSSERMWDVLETYRETVAGLETTNENILSHRLNDTIRVLTAFSVVLMPLTLVASIFGMNVQVPGEGEIAAFWVVVAGMAVGLVATIWYFRRRHWL